MVFVVWPNVIPVPAAFALTKIMANVNVPVPLASRRNWSKDASNASNPKALLAAMTENVNKIVRVPEAGVLPVTVRS